MGTILETERLLLRHLEPEDADAIYEIIGDPIAMQYYPRSFTRDDAVTWIHRNRQRYEDDGFGLCAVVLKSENAVIGDCGLTLQTVEDLPELEVGYHFQRKHWGRGYATEAARGCMKLAFEQFGAGKVISLIRPENVASRRVAERNGMKIERQIMRAGLPHLVYAMKRGEYVQT